MEDSYYKRNREKVLETVKAHREANKSYYKAQFNDWYRKNRETVLQKQKLYRDTVKQQKPVKQKPVKEKPVEQKKQETVSKPVIPVIQPVIHPSNVEIIDREIVVSFD